MSNRTDSKVTLYEMTFCVATLYSVLDPSALFARDLAREPLQTVGKIGLNRLAI